MHRPTYSIAPEVARRAAADYLVIMQAGMLDALAREISDSFDAYRGPPGDIFTPRYLCDRHIERDRDLRYGDAAAVERAEFYAADLAALLDCEQDQVAPYIVPPLVGHQTRRQLVLDTLAAVAKAARRQLAMERRNGCRT